MAFSDRKSVLECEISAFWELSRRGWHLIRTDIGNPELDEIRDDMQLILDMTGSPALRDTLMRGMRRDDARNRHPRKQVS